MPKLQFKTQNLKNTSILIIAKLLSYIIKFLNLGAGSTWPGEVILRLNKSFIKEIVNSNNFKAIIIAGTNGKTTTSTMIKYLLNNEDKRVFQNEEGANLLNGIASAIIKNSGLLGKLNYDYGVFEVDENTLPLVLNEINPYIIVLLNLFRDQLDRYGEVNTIALNWREGLKNLKKDTNLILNADDPLVASLGENIAAKVEYFTIDQKMMKVEEHTHDVDSIYCPRCQTKLNYQLIAYSHLGKYLCPNCGFKNPKSDFSPQNLKNSQLKGLYNMYNINAAILLLNKILKINFEKINHVLGKFKPAFGRQEEISYLGKKILFQLSKNPAGFNQSISVVKELAQKEKINLLMVLNDRIPDGRDVSWIWDVDLENIKDLPRYKKRLMRIVVSGDRCYDMGLRLKYAEMRYEREENLSKALKRIVEIAKKKEKIVILATYTGILDLRKIILGKKLL